MRRLARSTQSGVQGSPPVGPDAKRRVTRLGRRPRPSRLRCRGCAQALKASGRHVRSAEARGQGPRRRARGASDPSFGGPALLPYLPSRDPPDARGTDRAPRSPSGHPRGKPGRRAAAMPRAAPAARTTAHALSPPTDRFTHVGFSLLPPPLAKRVAGRADSGKARAGWGALPRAASSMIRRGCRWLPGPTAASSASPSRLAQPPPTPTPPRHSASPSGGREEREADRCESGSPKRGATCAVGRGRVRWSRGGTPDPAYTALYEELASLNRTYSPDGDGVARHRKA